MKNRKTHILVTVIISYFILGSTPIFAEDTGAEAVINADKYTAQGTAVYSIPIEVPPGRPGLTPSLAMVYNSNTRNSWVGYGWNLGVGYIQRSTRRGVNYSANDYEVNGSKKLVDRGNNLFAEHTEEGNFLKYNLVPSSGWEVTTKEGFIYKYGTTEESRLFNINNPNDIFRWCLDEVKDTNGNTMKITYRKFGTDGTYLKQIYLSKIEYMNVDSVYKNYIVFEGNPSVLGSAVSYVPGFETLNSFCSLGAIKIYANGQFVRKYDFTYTTKADPSYAGVYLLDQIKVIGSENGDISLPPISFKYRNVSSGNFIKANENVKLPHDNRHRFIFTDINGDGYSDPIFSRPCQFLHDCNNDNFNVFFSKAVFPFERESDGSLSAFQGDDYVNGSMFQSPHSTIGVGDIHGDGKNDIVAFMPDTVGVDQSTEYFHGGTDVTRVYTYYPLVENDHNLIKKDISNPNVADINGDGYSDIISIKNNSVEVYFGKGNGLFGETVIGEKGFKFQEGITRSIAGGNIDSNSVPMFGEINGDGLMDFIVYAGNVAKTYLSHGDGSFSYFSQKSFNFNGSNIAKLNVIDITGDGLVDLIFGVPNSNFLYISIQDPSLPDRFKNVFQIEYSGDFNKCSFGEINGDGLPDMIRLNDNNTAEVYLNSKLLQDENYIIGPPGLLEKVDNGMGGWVQFEYKPSTQNKKYNVPFILQQVAKIKVNDGINEPISTTFDYLNGLYDGFYREFYGYEDIIKTNPNGTSIKTKYMMWIHAKNKPEEIEYFDKTGKRIQKTRIIWKHEYLEHTANAPLFIYLRQKRNDFFGDNGVDVIVWNQEDVFPVDTNNYGIKNQIITEYSGSVGDKIISTKLFNKYGSTMWRLRQDKLESIGKTYRNNSYDYNGLTGNMLYQESWNNEGAGLRIDMSQPDCYDNYGNLRKVYDNKSQLTETEYESVVNAFPSKIIYSKLSSSDTNLLNVQYLDYDYRFGKPKKVIDISGQITSYTYDEFGRLIEASYPDGGKKEIDYTNYDSPNVFPRFILTKIKETDSKTIDLYEYFDGLGRVIKTKKKGIVIDQVSHAPIEKDIITEYHYNNMGLQWKTEGPYHENDTEYPVSEILFDDIGRPEYVKTYDKSRTLLTQFQYNGFDTKIIDPDECSKTIKKDYRGNIIEIVEHSDEGDSRTIYDYNGAGDLVAVTDNSDNITTITYNTLGQKRSIIDPDMGLWSYTYDANGNLETQTDANQKTVTFHYDALNRIKEKIYPNSSLRLFYKYDESNGNNFGRGRLSKVIFGEDTDNNGTCEKEISKTTYNQYDKMGRLKQVTKTLNVENNNPTDYTTDYTYDFIGNIKSIIYPGAIERYMLSYYYHEGTGLLKQIKGLSGSMMMTDLAYFPDYDPSGKIRSIKFGNNTTHTYTYDPRSGRIEGFRTQNPNGADIQSKIYTYKPSGDIHTIKDNQTGTTYTYTYDKLHRLKSETTDSEGPISENYQIIINEYDSNHQHAIKTLTLNDYKNQNTHSLNYNYDSNGNMLKGYDLTDISHPYERNITFNTDNMPQKIEVNHNGLPVRTDYVYDGNGTRIKKSSGSNNNYYISSHYEVINGTPVNYIFAGNMKFAMFKDNQIYYFHQDHLGSTSLVTSQSNCTTTSCSPDQNTEYLPYGKERSNTGNVTNYKYTGQEYDSTTGLYNYNARMYDPVIGTFISPDTIIPDPSDPQTLNRYAYCRNNPIMYRDPSGRMFAEIIYAAVSYILSAAETYISSYAVDGAVVGGALGGSASAATGGNFWDGVRAGAISGAFMGAGDYGILNGAISGGINASISGQDIGKGTLAGGLTGAIAPYSNLRIPIFGDSKIGWFASHVTSSAIVGGALGATYAAYTGGDIGQSALNGAKAWAIGNMTNQGLGHAAGLICTWKGPVGFNSKDGVYIYDENIFGTTFTVGGVIITGGNSEDNILGQPNTLGNQKTYYNVYTHEVSAHGPQQTIMSFSYLPVHLTAQGVSWALCQNTHRLNTFEFGWDYGYPNY